LRGRFDRNDLPVIMYCHSRESGNPDPLNLEPAKCGFCFLCNMVYYATIKNQMSEDKKEKFLRIYANLPLGIRQEIILVLDDGRPITWNVAFVEIGAETSLSEIILEKLEKLKII
jgi:hypothetical protein